MKLDLARIEMSKNDLRRGLTLPENMTEELAEDIGIMVGDGNISIANDGNRINYRLCISGDAIKDNEYFSNFIVSLKKSIYNLDFSVHYLGIRKTEIRLQAYSKGLLQFYLKVVGLPLGSKHSVRIPQIITNSDMGIKKRFLRGLIDTDGGITLRHTESKWGFYPSVKLSSASRGLIEDVSQILNELGLKHVAYYEAKRIHSKTGMEFITNQLELLGGKRVLQWAETIGFDNNKHLAKVSLIKEDYGPRGI